MNTSDVERYSPTVLSFQKGGRAMSRKFKAAADFVNDASTVLSALATFLTVLSTLHKG